MSVPVSLYNFYPRKFLYKTDIQNVTVIFQFEKDNKIEFHISENRLLQH